MRKIYVFILVLGFLFPLSLFSQSQLKIGHVDINKIMTALEIKKAALQDSFFN